MIQGLYLSAQGAEAQSLRHDVVANNLANASTTGFKRDLALFQAHRPIGADDPFAPPPPGNLNDGSGGISILGVATDFSNGSLTETGAELDVALVGAGFLNVTNGQDEFLTRNGRLTIDPSRQLVTAGDGLAVLDDSGTPIEIPGEATALEITSDGAVVVTSPDGARSRIASLGLVQPATEGDLYKVGHTLYATGGKTVPAGPGLQVRQGFLEESGTNAVQETMEMIQAARGFELNMNMIRHQDDMLGRLLQSVARR